MVRTVKVAVTGAAGQIGYAILPRLASGEVFGRDVRVSLHLLEITPALKALEGVVMELDDCAFPLLDDIVITDQAEVAFDGINWGLLIGSKPRGPGMERGDLIRENGPIFVGQGQALARAAADVRVLVVGNPANTNGLIAMSHGHKAGIPRDRFHAMTRLDQNRAQAQLANKAGVKVAAVSNMAIWGNHSATQYPDAENAHIEGAPGTRRHRPPRLVARGLHPNRPAAGCGRHRRPRLVVGPRRLPMPLSTTSSVLRAPRLRATFSRLVSIRTAATGLTRGCCSPFPFSATAKATGRSCRVWS